MAKLTLIGTGHVFRIEDTIRQAIFALQPDHVLVELDGPRLQALQARAAGVKQTSGGGFVHKRLQEFQEQIAKDNDATPGGEMLAAVQAGYLTGARVGLIDQDVNVTLKRALSELTLREKLRAGGSFVKGTVLGWFGKNQGVEEELAKYQNDPEAALTELANTFPTVRRVVIDERDDYMVRQINELVGDDVHAVVVIGDGHANGMIKKLEGHEITAYRLQEVREGNLPKPPGTNLQFSLRLP